MDNTLHLPGAKGYEKRLRELARVPQKIAKLWGRCDWSGDRDDPAGPTSCLPEFAALVGDMPVAVLLSAVDDYAVSAAQYAHPPTPVEVFRYAVASRRWTPPNSRSLETGEDYEIGEPIDRGEVRERMRAIREQMAKRTLQGQLTNPPPRHQPYNEADFEGDLARRGASVGREEMP